MVFGIESQRVMLMDKLVVLKSHFIRLFVCLLLLLLFVKLRQPMHRRKVAVP